MNRLTVAKIPLHSIFEILFREEPQAASIHFIDKKAVKCVGENCHYCITAKTLSEVGSDDWKHFIKHHRWVFKAKSLDGTDFEFEVGKTIFNGFLENITKLKIKDGDRLYFYNDYTGKNIYMDLNSCRFIHRMKTVSRMYRMDGTKDQRPRRVHFKNDREVKITRSKNK